MSDKDLLVPDRRKMKGASGFSKADQHLKTVSLKLVSPRLGVFLRWFLILTLLAVYPLSFILPKEFGWEDGLIEWTQVVVLAVGFVLAYLFAGQVEERLMARYWRWTTPLWLLMFGREIDWGATFLPPASIGAFGPKYLQLSDLWYGPAVYPFLALLLITWIVVVVKYKLYQVPLQMLRERTLPIFEALFTVFITVLFYCADQRIISITGHAQMFEELLELIVYISFVVLAIATQREITKK